jgi:hypothetical protein
MMQEASKEEKQKAMVTADKLLKDGGYSKTTKVKVMDKKKPFVIFYLRRCYSYY